MKIEFEISSDIFRNIKDSLSDSLGAAIETIKTKRIGLVNKKVKKTVKKKKKRAVKVS